MALKFLNRFPGANARLLSLRAEGPQPELTFAADPLGGELARWFHFRVEDAAPPEPLPEALRLTLRFCEDFAGAQDAAMLRPVVREAGKNWFRLKPPAVALLPDGQRAFSWSLPYPQGNTEIALSHPYYRDELSALLSHGKGYWQEEAIGLTRGGRVQSRLRNDIAEGCAACPHPRGLYLLARHQAGDAPASWVLDGMLEAISRAKPVNWCVWAMPFVDLDGVAGGLSASVPDGQGMRLLQDDLQRWATRCTPELIIELCAPDVAQGAGLRGRDLRAAGGAAEAGKAAQAWLNVLRQGLAPEYAADPFAAGEPAGTADGLSAASPGCTALALEVPYALCGSLLLAPKQYREAGQRVARAILTRR